PILKCGAIARRAANDVFHDLRIQTRLRPEHHCFDRSDGDDMVEHVLMSFIANPWPMPPTWIISCVIGSSARRQTSTVSGAPRQSYSRQVAAQARVRRSGQAELRILTPRPVASCLARRDISFFSMVGCGTKSRSLSSVRNN